MYFEIILFFKFINIIIFWCINVYSTTETETVEIETAEIETTENKTVAVLDENERTEERDNNRSN